MTAVFVVVNESAEVCDSLCRFFSRCYPDAPIRIVTDYRSVSEESAVYIPSTPVSHEQLGTTLSKYFGFKRFVSRVI